MKSVLITDGTFADFAQEQAAVEAQGASLKVAQLHDEASVMAAAEQADVLVVQFAPITAAVIERLPAGARIVRYGLGLDNIDLEEARRREVPVAYVPDYATGEVADHTATLIVSTLRKIGALDASVRDGLWDPVGVARPIKAFKDSTVGFVGYGRIGREVYARLAAFGFSGLVYDPFASDDALVGLERVELDMLFERADVITLHCPLTAQNRHVVNADRLAKMLPNAIVVNTARGGLIDTEALARALQCGTIGGAALDVFEVEPLGSDSALRDCPNLTLTPHAAWYSAASMVRLQALAADEIDRALEGRPPRCPAYT